MKTVLGIGTALAVVLLGGTARASYPCGIYAHVYDVKLEPDATSPTSVKVSGDFVLAGPGSKLSEPRRGFLCFSIVKGKEETCRAEWADLKKMASTDLEAANYVGFGSTRINADEDPNNRGNQPKVFEKDGPDVKPVPYPLNQGLVRLRVRDPEEGGQQPVVLLRTYREKNPLPTDKR
jgi:hypothetical protein